MDTEKKLTLAVVGKIADIPAAEWDACSNPKTVNPASLLPYDPFVSHGFLSALEDSESTCAETGWAPYHLKLEDAGRILAVMPMYLKNHSQGEYVFDYSWADAFERAGGSYYPKLQVSIPFTPVSGRRLLTMDCADAELHEQYLLGGCMQVAKQMDVSSVHITFADKSQWQAMGDMGFLQRTHQQFHWRNNNYTDFDDFLGALSSKKRKNIRRERRFALQGGIQIERLRGDDIKEHHWDAFFRFYLDTGSRKWGTPYLTRQFFSLLSERIPDNVLLIMVKRDDRYIAGAINFIGSDCLYGRNWGCIEYQEFLHFEVCYYQAIEYAIEQGLDRVEAGAQGQHKLARGYLPTHTYSAHWIADAGFRKAVADFVTTEREHVSLDIEYLGHRSPFRKH